MSPILVDGDKLDILEDGKRYIKFYIDLQPEAVNLSRKMIKKDLYINKKQNFLLKFEILVKSNLYI